jgi:DNA-binding NarL/FixJ family response regulator
MNSEKKARIMIAEDHPLFRKALRDLLRDDVSLDLVAETGDGREVVPMAVREGPDILLLDLNLPNLSGIECARQLRDSGCGAKIIVLTMHKEEEVFNRVMDEGVAGYVLKEAAVDVILESIHAVRNGDHYISPSLAHYLISRRGTQAALKREHPGFDDLTPTELKILRLISEEKTSKDIAALLFISEKTVENHRTNISNKLSLRGSNNLLKFAIAHRSILQV